MAVRQVGIVVQYLGGGHQVPGDPCPELLGKRVQLGADVAVQLLARDLIRQRRTIVDVLVDPVGPTELAASVGVRQAAGTTVPRPVVRSTRAIAAPTVG